MTCNVVKTVGSNILNLDLFHALSFRRVIAGLPGRSSRTVGRARVKSMYSLRRATLRRSSHLPIAPWEVRPDAPDLIQRAAASILSHGFVLIQALLPTETLARLKEPLSRHSAAILDAVRVKGAKLGVGRYGVPAREYTFVKATLPVRCTQSFSAKQAACERTGRRCIRPQVLS